MTAGEGRNDSESGTKWQRVGDEMTAGWPLGGGDFSKEGKDRTISQGGAACCTVKTGHECKIIMVLVSCELKIGRNMVKT